ncbi:ABC transporter substrate-binding protein [Psychrobacter sp. FDAARGOS_221]|uniref:ABC transporter substrate-binding protein n=1 Tax=Psychrobacter sp. FDAARGOS_221 TaxID=1975705 RepID=UPI000BB58152|nr:ABC transporter substrate-binding protein [Psychrobacter sp. FDAARGOS_221]PNK60797.1 oligopeptide ABC transporter substrate-binding protein OppA [Psychrobacter sp. FDAARGOS_221]
MIRSPRIQSIAKPLAKPSLALALTALLSISLVGCGDKEAVNNQSIDDTVLAEDQSIVINNTAEPESIDPHKVSAVPEGNIIRQLFIGLVDTDRQGKTVPGMAESWESTDNKVWTFKLRDAKWSNGDPVTADDFVYSWQRLVDPNTASPYASYLVDAKVNGAEAVMNGNASVDTLGIKALDDKTVQITLIESVPYFPDMLIHTSTKPVHKNTVEQYGDDWTNADNIVVNGPYTLSDWRVNDHIELKRNPQYFDDANTVIETVTILPISSPTTDVSRYKAGEVDVSAEVPPEQFDDIKASMGDELRVAPRLCTYYYKYNTVKPPFNDARVRRALALALDRDIIAEKVMGQGQEPAYQLTPPSTNGMNNFTPQWKAWSKEKRIEEANKLLTQAGYSASNPLKFELLYNTSDNHKKIAVAFSSIIKDALGDDTVDIELVNKEWKTYLDTRRNGNYDIARSSWCGDYNEPSSFLNTLKTDNTNNHGKYSSMQFDSLLNQTLLEGVDAKQRASLYQQAEAQLDTDMPNLNMFHYVGVRLVKPYVIGFPDQDPLDVWHMKDVSIAKH